MKTSLKFKFFLSALLFFIGIKAYSQDDFRSGWIVLAKGDTVKGLVQYYISDKVVDVCHFHESETEKVNHFTSKEISSFGYSDNSKVFISKDTLTGASPVFMEVVIRGKVSLFRYGQIFYLEKASLYKLELEIKQVVDQSVSYEQEKKKFAGVLNYLFSDCPGGPTSKEIMDADYREVDLARLTTKYNKCIGSPYIDFKRNQKAIVVTYTATTGISYSNFQYQAGNYPYKTDKNANLNGINPIIGGGLEIRSPRVNENMAFTTELQFSTYAFKETTKQQFELYYLEEYYKLKYLRFKIPLGFKYNFSSAPTSLYVRTGFCFNFFFNGSITASQSKDFTTGTDTFKEDNSSIDSYRMNQLFVSFGKQLNFPNKLKGFVEFQVEVFGGHSQPPIQNENGAVVIEVRSMDNKAVSLNLGVNF